MKIAIVCDWLVTVGGAEKVLQQMLECFPQADLYSLIDFLPQDKRYIIHNKMVTTSFIQKLPLSKKYYRKYLSLMPLAIEQFDFSTYDVVISSSHAVAKGVITGPNQLHICYCHSPMRYAWDMQGQYLRESGLERGVFSWLARWLLHKMRIWDYRTSNGVDYFIANSQFIARRIYKIYRRQAQVIYPPVATNDISGMMASKEKLYVAASRMVPYKKLDLIIRAFLEQPQHELVVIGDGPMMRRLKQLADTGKNIHILGYQSDAVLMDYLAKARALIFAAEEDFGIIPVEAQASGTPVIAYDRGGTAETVIDYRSQCSQLATGVLFSKQTVEDIVAAIRLFEDEAAAQIKAESCINNAKRFAQQKFKEDFKHVVIEQYTKFKQAQAMEVSGS